MLKIKNLTKVYGDKKAVATNRKRSMSVGIAGNRNTPMSISDISVSISSVSQNRR